MYGINDMKILRFKLLMLLKRMYGINDMKILWFAISYPFKRMFGINQMKMLGFAISYTFIKDVWDKRHEDTLICNFSCFSKGCME